MKTHQAGQQDALIEINMSLDNNSTARASNADHHHDCFKRFVALTTLMGLVILGLVVFIVLYGLMFMQGAGPPGSTTKNPIIIRALNKTDVPGRYDIFTANKAATYYIYGWMKLPNPTGKSIELKHILDKRPVTLERKAISCTEVFFHDDVKLISNSILSIFFNDDKSNYIDVTFHIYEL